MSEPSEMSGILFANFSKKGRGPDYRGEVKLNGEIFTLSGWRKRGRRGEFIGLSLSRREVVPPPESAPTPEAGDPF